MKQFGFLFLVTLLAGGGLGGCSSALDYTSSIGEKEAFRIGRAGTTQAERDRLIKMLTRIEHTHRRDALREIAAR